MGLEYLSDENGQIPQKCVTCPAKVFAEGRYRCNPSILDEKSDILDVARYRPDGCPKNVKEIGNQELTLVQLRKILGK